MRAQCGSPDAHKEITILCAHEMKNVSFKVEQKKDVRRVLTEAFQLPLSSKLILYTPASKRKAHYGKMIEVIGNVLESSF